jgi:hypothetical protein
MKTFVYVVKKKEVSRTKNKTEQWYGRHISSPPRHTQHQTRENRNNRWTRLGA